MLVGRIVARFQWRCRQCEAITSFDYLEPDEARGILERVMLVPNEYCKGVRFFKTHHCKEYTVGVSELIGYEIIDTYADAARELAARELKEKEPSHARSESSERLR